MSCPHCGGISGAISSVKYKAERVYYWDAETNGGIQDTDCFTVTSETIPKCMDCGKRVPTLRAARQEESDV